MQEPDRTDDRPGTRPASARAASAGDAASALLALASLDAGVIVCDHSWRIVFANAAAESFVGGLPGVRGRRLWDVLPAVADDSVRQELETSLTHRVPCSVRIEIGAGRGRGVHDLRIVPSTDAVTIELRDAADLVRLERDEALRKLARELAVRTDSRALLDTLCAAARAHCDADGASVILVNDGEGHVVAATGRGLAAPGTRFLLAGSLTTDAIRLRATVTTENYADTYPDRTNAGTGYRPGPVMVTPLLAHDQLLGVLIVSRTADATPFSRAERSLFEAVADYASLALWKSQLLEEAQAANLAKSNFLATMSHELRTPLTALTGYGELLADQIIGPLDDAQLDLVERMRSVTHHLAVMIEEILSFASIEAGRELVRVSEGDSRDVARAAAAVIEPLASQKGLWLRVDEAESFTLETDVDKVRQILVNLAGNAVKFTDAGEVRMTADCKGGIAEFRVKDTGIGIAAEDISRLFQPFSQVDGGLTRRHGGTGLGLYISQRLAALLGGSISVVSAVAKGSEFTLRIPTRYRAEA